MRAENIDLAELVYMASVYRKRRFYSEAVDLLTQALSNAHGDAEPNSSALVQYSLAKVYEAQGNIFFARELYAQALNDWLGGKTANPIHQIWRFRSLGSLERACDQLIKAVERRNEIQDLPLPSMATSEKWLKAG
jgi:tetratricopeptide (TPR) repeat protein